MFEYYRWNIFRLLNDDLLTDWDIEPPSTFVRLRLVEVWAWIATIQLLEIAEEYSHMIPCGDNRFYNPHTKKITKVTGQPNH